MAARSWGGGSGQWSAASNWQGDILPGVTDNAIFPAGPYAVTFDTTATIDAISAFNAVTLDMSGGLLVLTGAQSSSRLANTGDQLDQTGGTIVVQQGSFAINGFDQTAGTLIVAPGADVSDGAWTLAGTVAGGGTLISGGNLTLDGATLSVARLNLGGILTVAADTTATGQYGNTLGTVDLDGNTLTIASGAMGGRIVGPGELLITGSVNLAGAVITGIGGQIVDAGTITTDATFSIGDTATDEASVLIEPGAVFDLLTDSGIDAETGTLLPEGIVNQGLLEKTQGNPATGNRSNVQAAIDNTGTLRVDRGNLLLTGATDGGSQLGGTITGAGSLDIGGLATLDAGAVVNIGSLYVTYGGTLALAANADIFGDVEQTLNGTIQLNGNSLTIQGAGVLAGYLASAGTVGSAGSLFIGGSYALGIPSAAEFVVTGGTVWLEDMGYIRQLSGVGLGVTGTDHVAFQIDTHAVYDMAAPGNLTTYNSGTTLDAGILNNGLFEHTVNSGSADHITTAFANNIGGTVLVTQGTLDWDQSFINDGNVTIDGAAAFAGGVQASTGHFGTLTIGSHAVVHITGTVNPKSTIDFAGTGGTLELSTPLQFQGTIENFAAGDVIELLGKTVNTHLVSASGLALTLEIYSTLEGSLEVFDVGQLAFINPPGGGYGEFAITGDDGADTDILATYPGNVGNPLIYGSTIDAYGYPGFAGSGDFFNNSIWSLGVAPTAAYYDASISSSGTISYTGAAVVNTASLYMGTLSFTSGRLTVNNGGTVNATDIDMSGGAIESVTGLVMDFATYDLDAGTELESDNSVLSLSGGDMQVLGTLGGVGEILFNHGTLTSVPGDTVSVATLDIGSATFVPYAGEIFTDTLLLDDATMPLFDNLITVTNAASLYATIPDGGTVVVASGASVDASQLVMQGTSDEVQIQGFARLTNGNIAQSATTSLVSIAAGATLDFESDVNVFTGGSVVNAGLIEKTGGGGQSRVTGAFVSTDMITIDSGTLWLDSTAARLGGSIEGQGVLDTQNPGGTDTATLEAGLFVNAATFLASNLLLGENFSYGGVFNDNASIALQGHTLDLYDTTELAGTITGPGVLHLGGTADSSGLLVQGSGATIDDEGFLSQSSIVTLGGTTSDTVTLRIGAGHVYDSDTDAYINGVVGGTVTGTIVNQGLFEKTAGGGVTNVYALAENTGTVLAGHGTLDFRDGLVNDALVHDSATLVLDSAVTADSGQHGTILLDSNATLTINAAFAASQTITYDPGGLVQLAQLSSFAGTIDGLLPDDSLDLLNTFANGASYDAADGVLTLLNGVTPVGTIALRDASNPQGISVAPDGNSGTDVIEAACYAIGTRILTTRGQIAVENLVIGDTAINPWGERLPIQWIGRRRVDCHRHARPWNVRPVRVRAGAFAENIPSRDLVLSPDHAVYCDGVLIPVRYLINGASIAQLAADAVTYFHVELFRHDILLAENLPAESYLDTGNRAAFENGGKPMELHPDFAREAWNTLACARLVTAGPALLRERAALLARAAALGFVATGDAAPTLRAGGRIFTPLADGPGRLRFDLPPGLATARLCSSTAVPAQVRADGADHRRLGLAVAGLWLDGAGMALDDPRLGPGWHAPEPDFRWTAGDAVIEIDGARSLALHVLPLLTYWRSAA